MGNLGLLTRSALVVMPRADAERARDALHEAGHSLLHVLVRDPFEYVTLRPPKLHIGRFMVIHRGSHRHRALKRALCDCAGSAAYESIHGVPDPQAEADRKHALHVLAGLRNAPRLEEVYKVALDLVHEYHWPLMSISMALIGEGALTYWETQDLLRMYCDVPPLGEVLGKLLA